MIRNKNKYNFILIMSGIYDLNESIEDGLFKAGCDDATLSFHNQAAYLEFDREADNLKYAVLSAIRDVEDSGLGIKVIGVEPGDLVNAAEIARRANVSREYVRKLMNTENVKSKLPVPRQSLNNATTLWSWAEISNWLYSMKILKNTYIMKDAELIRDINEILKESLLDKSVLKRRKELFKELTM